MHLLNNNNVLLEKLKTQKSFTQKEEGELFNLCAIYMLGIFNEIPNAMNYLEQSKYYLKKEEPAFIKPIKIVNAFFER